VTGSDDKTARLWDLTSKDPAAGSIVLHGHEYAITAVAISADNHWLVTGSVDKTARLWDLRAKDPTAASIVLRGHENPISAVAISSDNHWLVTGSGDDTAHLWTLRLNDLVELACRTAGRNLTKEEWAQYMGNQPYQKTCSNFP
jgi:WD40 repeat protein